MGNPSIHRLRCAERRDAEGILAIYAPIVRQTSITFEVEPPTVEAEALMTKKLMKDSDTDDRHSFLWRWIQGYPTRLAVYAPVLGALLVVAVGIFIGTDIYHSNPPPKFGDIVLFIAFLIASLTGWIQIWLREAYGFVWPVRGRAAIIWGALWVAVCWGAAILFIWDVFAGPAR